MADIPKKTKNYDSTSTGNLIIATAFVPLSRQVVEAHRICASLRWRFTATTSQSGQSPVLGIGEDQAWRGLYGNTGDTIGTKSWRENFSSGLGTHRARCRCLRYRSSAGLVGMILFIHVSGQLVSVSRLGVVCSWRHPEMTNR